MPITKRVAVLLAGPVTALATIVPATPARATTAASICTLFSSVHFDNGIPADPTVPVTGRYDFWGATAICAGGVTGAAGVSSTGTYTAGIPLSSFTGTISTTAFTLGGSCYGTIGGVLSVRVGTIMSATLNLTCGPTPLGGLTSATGAMALHFVPNPLTINTCGWGGTTDPYICDGTYGFGAAVLAGS